MCAVCNKRSRKNGQIISHTKEQILVALSVEELKGMFPNKSVRFLVCVIVMFVGNCPISSYVSRPSSPQVGKVEYVPGEILVKVKKVVSRKEKLEPSLKGRSGVLPKGRDILKGPRDLKGFSIDILLKEHKPKALI